MVEMHTHGMIVCVDVIHQLQHSLLIRCYIYTNYLLNSLSNKFSSTLLDITNYEWWRHFTSSFSSKLIVITNYNCTYKVKPFCNWICDYKSFLPCVTKDSPNNNHKNDWFGHKFQTHGWVWTRFCVVFAFNLETWTTWLSETMKHNMVFPFSINQIWWW